MSLTHTEFKNMLPPFLPAHMRNTNFLDQPLFLQLDYHCQCTANIYLWFTSFSFKLNTGCIFFFFCLDLGQFLPSECFPPQLSCQRINSELENFTTYLSLLFLLLVLTRLRTELRTYVYQTDIIPFVCTTIPNVSSGEIPYIIFPPFS